MARKQKLKVYRTPIGFHDAYVAASSQKAALKAWGADVDLFARGVAEAVDDEKLTRAALEKPGSVIRIPRGTSADHMAALPKDEPPRRRPASPAEDDGPTPRRRTRSEPKRPARRAVEDESDEAPVAGSPARAPKSRAKARPKPRPSRDRLDDAERALELAETVHKDEVARIREQEKELQRIRRDFETRHKDHVARLETAIAKARKAYGAALEKWRS